MKRILLTMVVTGLFVFGFTACDNSADGVDAPEIAGVYSDGYGTHTVGNDTWKAEYPGADGGDPVTAVVELTVVDNDADFTVGENADNTWSRYDWTVVGQDLYYCQIEYAAASEDDALANENADRTDPASSGCGGFAWSLLTPVE